MAIKARMKVFKFRVTHDYSERRPFPLTAGKIATLIKHFVEVGRREQ